MISPEEFLIIVFDLPVFIAGKKVVYQVISFNKDRIGSREKIVSRHGLQRAWKPEIEN